MTVRLTDYQWQKILFFLKGYKIVCMFRKFRIGDEDQCRKFIEAVLWVTKSGAQWRLLPKEYGKWNSVFKRFDRWAEQAVWQAMFEYFAEDADMESILIDSTIVRAHSCAAGGQGGNEEQHLGRSKGGYTSKLHCTTDALGNPLRLILSPGQRNDVTKAEELLEDFRAQRVMGDKGYDAQVVLDKVAEMGAEVVIPPKSNRKEQREYDKEYYKERHLIEIFFNKIKHYRRIFSRFEKMACNYLAFCQFASVLIWLR